MSNVSALDGVLTSLDVLCTDTCIASKYTNYMYVVAVAIPCEIYMYNMHENM